MNIVQQMPYSETKMERLSKDEAVLIALVHHDHRGRPLKEAADDMEIGLDKARRLLTSAEEKCPSLFPILTGRQARILHLFTVEDLENEEIAAIMGIKINTVKTHIRRLRGKGFLRDGHNLSKRLSFDEATMSGGVKQRW